MPDPSDIAGATESEHLLSLSEMVDLFGVTPRTVRYYEYMELISSTQKGRIRYYDARAQARFKLALRGRRFGMRLEDVRLWLEIYDSDGKVAQLERWVEIDKSLRATLRAEIAEREAALEELDGLRSAVCKELQKLEA